MSSPQSQSAIGRRRSNVRQYSVEDQALNMISKEAEARLAAKRAARAEAREIRMKEIEKQNKNTEDKQDKIYELTNEHAAAKMRQQVSGSRRGSIESNDSGADKDIDIKTELRELEDKYKAAMMTSAQLDNEKQSLVYQVELLKDQLEEQDEGYTELQREYKDKCREFELQKRDMKNMEHELSILKQQLELKDRLIQESGFVIMSNDKGEPILEKQSSSLSATANENPLPSGDFLVSPETKEFLEKAGDGTLGTPITTSYPTTNLSVVSDSNDSGIFADDKLSVSFASPDKENFDTFSDISPTENETKNIEIEKGCDDFVRTGKSDSHNCVVCDTENVVVVDGNNELGTVNGNMHNDNCSETMSCLSPDDSERDEFFDAVSTPSPVVRSKQIRESAKELHSTVDDEGSSVDAVSHVFTLDNNNPEKDKPNDDNIFVNLSGVTTSESFIDTITSDMFDTGNLSVSSNGLMRESSVDGISYEKELDDKNQPNHSFETVDSQENLLEKKHKSPEEELNKVDNMKVKERDSDDIIDEKDKITNRKTNENNIINVDDDENDVSSNEIFVETDLVDKENGNEKQVSKDSDCKELSVEGEIINEKPAMNADDDLNKETVFNSDGVDCKHEQKLIDEEGHVHHVNNYETLVENVENLQECDDLMNEIVDSDKGELDSSDNLIIIEPATTEFSHGIVESDKAEKRDDEIEATFLPIEENKGAIEAKERTMIKAGKNNKSCVENVKNKEGSVKEENECRKDDMKKDEDNGVQSMQEKETGIQAVKGSIKEEEDNENLIKESKDNEKEEDSIKKVEHNEKGKEDSIKEGEEMENGKESINEGEEKEKRKERERIQSNIEEREKGIESDTIENSNEGEEEKGKEEDGIESSIKEEEEREKGIKWNTIESNSKEEEEKEEEGDGIKGGIKEEMEKGIVWDTIESSKEEKKGKEGGEIENNIKEEEERGKGIEWDTIETINKEKGKEGDGIKSSIKEEEIEKGIECDTIESSKEEEKGKEGGEIENSMKEEEREKGIEWDTIESYNEEEKGKERDGIKSSINEEEMEKEKEESIKEWEENEKEKEEGIKEGEENETEKEEGIKEGEEKEKEKEESIKEGEEHEKEKEERQNEDSFKEEEKEKGKDDIIKEKEKDRIKGVLKKDVEEDKMNEIEQQYCRGISESSDAAILAEDYDLDDIMEGLDSESETEIKGNDNLNKIKEHMGADCVVKDLGEEDKIVQGEAAVSHNAESEGASVIFTSHNIESDGIENKLVLTAEEKSLVGVESKDLAEENKSNVLSDSVNPDATTENTQRRSKKKSKKFSLFKNLFGKAE